MESSGDWCFSQKQAFPTMHRQGLHECKNMFIERTYYLNQET